MLQIQMSNPGDPEVLSLKKASIPTPKENEVLIEVFAAGVNRPDLMQRQGNYPPPPDASPILGLEVAGKIVTAPIHSRFKSGDEVCALVNGGGYSQYCVAPESQCLPIPRGLSFIEAAGIPETFFTVWANVFQLGQLKKGERFLVHGGSSGIGTTAIQLARSIGAEVFTTVGTEEKAKICQELGASTIINYKTQNFADVIDQTTSGQGVHLILDMIGGSYTEKNLNSLAVGGRLVQIATQQGPVVSIDLFKIMRKRLKITGSTLRPRSLEDKARIAEELRQNVWPLLEEGKVKVVLNRVFPIEEASEAHAYLESGDNYGKVVLKVRD